MLKKLIILSNFMFLVTLNCFMQAGPNDAFIILTITSQINRTDVPVQGPRQAVKQSRNFTGMQQTVQNDDHWTDYVCCPITAAVCAGACYTCPCPTLAITGAFAGMMAYEKINQPKSMQ